MLYEKSGTLSAGFMTNAYAVAVGLLRYIARPRQVFPVPKPMTYAGVRQINNQTHWQIGRLPDGCTVGPRRYNF